MRKQLQSLALFLLCIGQGHAQTLLDDAGFTQWLENDIDFIMFDTRGDNTVDSIIYPCFYTGNVVSFIDSIPCDKRLLISCHAGGASAADAQAVASKGYPADSIYYSGFSLIPSTRYPASDTIPLTLLSTVASVDQDISALELASIVHSKRDYQLVDIRRPSEIAEGMIPGACWVNWEDGFTDQYTRFGTDQLIVLYCRSGGRAGNAENFLVQNGYDENLIINFGGFSKWEDQGLPISYEPTEGCVCEEAVSVTATDNERSLSVRTGLTLGNDTREVEIYSPNGKLIFSKALSNSHSLNKYLQTKHHGIGFIRIKSSITPFINIQ